LLPIISSRKIVSILFMSLAREENYPGRWFMDRYLKTFCKSAAKERLLETYMISMRYCLFRARGNQPEESICHFLSICSVFTQTITSSKFHQSINSVPFCQGFHRWVSPLRSQACSYLFVIIDIKAWKEPMMNADHGNKAITEANEERTQKHCYLCTLGFSGL
jgi:hypothetical protein